MERCDVERRQLNALKHVTKFVNFSRIKIFSPSLARTNFSRASAHSLLRRWKQCRIIWRNFPEKLSENASILWKVKIKKNTRRGGKRFADVAGYQTLSIWCVSFMVSVNENCFAIAAIINLLPESVYFRVLKEFHERLKIKAKHRWNRHVKHF